MDFLDDGWLWESGCLVMVGLSGVDDKVRREFGIVGLFGGVGLSSVGLSSVVWIVCGGDRIQSGTGLMSIICCVVLVVRIEA